MHVHTLRPLPSPPRAQACIDATKEAGDTTRCHQCMKGHAGHHPPEELMMACLDCVPKAEGKRLGWACPQYCTHHGIINNSECGEGGEGGGGDAGHGRGWGVDGAQGMEGGGVWTGHRAWKRVKCGRGTGGRGYGKKWRPCLEHRTGGLAGCRLLVIAQGGACTDNI
eukprot:354569-Chlamydomonas_euryale.AAC.7